ncbi:Probable RNA methyltransferase At5g51130 [Linum grandiflorum]
MAETKEKRAEVIGEKKRKRDEKKQKKDHQRKDDDENNDSQAEKIQKQNGQQKPQNHQVTGGSNNQKKKKKPKLVFPFGNYRNYYGYRIDQGLDEDPRLKVLKKEWFEGKDCLDIGCNSGIMTIHMAKKFNCQSILGIDIDPDRISDAYWHLRKFSREHCGSSSTNVSKEQIREKLNASKQSTESQLGEDKEMEKDATLCKGKNFFDAVSFRQENFVDNHNSHEKPYDVILCLSVAKWIHLNWGDDGLIKLFSEVWKLLVPGLTEILMNVFSRVGWHFHTGAPTLGVV